MSEPTSGFIGLGMMGAAMAGRLQAAGVRLAVHNRTREKADPFLARGARWCSTPGEVAVRCGVVMSMVSDSRALEEIVHGPDGILASDPADLLHVDCSTVSPATTERLSQAYRDHRCSFLHAPVLGSVTQAAEGSLLIFAGGTDADFARAQRLLDPLGNRVWRFSAPREASHAKLVCNLFIAGMITTLGEGLVLAEKAGVPPRTILDILRSSSLNAPMYQSKGASILDDNFAPRFFLEHMLKDINLMLDAARRLDVRLPGIEAAQQLFQSARERGLGKEDYSAVIKALRPPLPPGS